MTDQQVYGTIVMFIAISVLVIVQTTRILVRLDEILEHLRGEASEERK